MEQPHIPTWPGKMHVGMHLYLLFCPKRDSLLGTVPPYPCVTQALEVPFSWRHPSTSRNCAEACEDYSPTSGTHSKGQGKPRGHVALCKVLSHDANPAWLPGFTSDPCCLLLPPSLGGIHVQGVPCFERGG